MKSNGNTILPDFITGINETGFDAFTMPPVLCFVLTALWVFIQTRGDRFQLILKRIFSVTLGIMVFTSALISWLIGIVSNGFYLPIGNSDDNSIILIWF